MNAVLDGLKALGAARLVAMAVVAVGMLGLLGLLAMRGGSAPMALLYADLDAREAGQIVDRLDREHVPNQVVAGGTAIMVPGNEVPRLRALLARDGLPSGGSIGYELLDKSSGLGASAFEQKIAETRALEGELVRSIRAIAGVRAARVHLVLPRREPFSRDRQEAQASVLINSGPGRLDRESVQAILNLVAGAVPGLHPKQISIIDSRGNVLARAGEPAGPAAAAQTAEEQRLATEQRLSRAVEEMLERSLGPGHVRAEATVEMNYEQLRETQETYNPDGQVLRSSQTVTDSAKNTEPAKSVTIQNNLPNANAGAGAGSQSQRQEETNNYEISKTVRTLVRDQPQIRRISLAVMVDGIEAKGADGKPEWKPRPAEELARIKRLVQSAVGYDQKRGDQVDVVSMRFAGDTSLLPAPAPGLLGMHFDKADLMQLAQNGLVALIGLAALLFVFRPMVTRLTSLAPAALPAGMAMAGAGGALGGGGGLGMAAGSEAAMLEAVPGVPRLPAPEGGGGEEESGMVQVQNVEGQLRASSIRKLGELVEKHPEESLTIVRAWMQEGTG